MIAGASSVVPFVAAATASSPRSRRRAIASIMTMASSTTSPTATAIPPRDMRLSVWWNSFMKPKLIASVMGTEMPARRPARRSRRNRPMTVAHRRMPSTIASRTPAMESLTRFAWS